MGSKRELVSAVPLQRGNCGWVQCVHIRCLSFPYAGAGTVRSLWTKLFALAASPVVAGKPWESWAVRLAVTSLQFSHERQEKKGTWLSQRSRRHRQCLSLLSCLSSVSSWNITEACPFYCSWRFNVVLQVAGDIQCGFMGPYTIPFWESAAFSPSWNLILLFPLSDSCSSKACRANDESQSFCFSAQSLHLLQRSFSCSGFRSWNGVGALPGYTCIFLIYFLCMQMLSKHVPASGHENIRSNCSCFVYLFV